MSKVTLVPEDCGPNWIPSQSFQVLRPLPGTDPICLFHQLRSQKVQTQITYLITGGTVPQIKAADISNLPIPVLAQGETRRIRAVHEKMLTIGRQIRQLKHQRAALAASLDQPEGVEKS